MSSRPLSVISTAALLALRVQADAAPPGVAVFEEAKKTFELGQFHRSLALFARARKQAREKQLIAEIELNLGINHAVLGDKRQARRAFEQALRHRATLDLDPDRHKPAIVKLFREVRSALRGQLQVSGGPPRAQVLVDGKIVGPTPFVGPVDVGQLKVQVRDAKGASLWQKDLVVAPDHTVVVKLQGEGRPTTTTMTTSTAGEGLFAQPAIRRRAARRPRLLWTWVAAGGAVVAAAVGIGFGVAAKNDHDEYMNTDDPQRFDELADRIPGRATTANVMFGLAGALAVGATVLFFVERRASAPSKGTAIVPDLSPGHAGLRLGGHF